MKQAFIEKMKELGFTKGDAEKALSAFADVTKSQLAEDYEAKIPGLGKLVLKQSTARVGRNPKTGEPVDIPARNVVRWRPSKPLLDALNG